MKGLSLYSKILRNTWLIDKVEAEAYLPAVMKLLTGQEVALYEEDEKSYEVYALSPFTVKKYSDLSEAPQGSIAIIPVEDVLDKDDYCGVPGTKTLTQRLEKTLSYDNIIGAVLSIDSPGGSPYGTESFANAILAAEKPVVSLVEGRAASAAYWIASATDHIFLQGNITKVGSIGTYATIRDFTKYYEELGVKIWEIYATDSTEKNAGVRQLIEKGDANTLREKELDPINKAFMKHVTDTRGSKIDLAKENVLTGKMYTGQEAIDVGLADETGTMLDALQKVEDLSNQLSNKSKSTDMFNSNKKLKAFTALIEKSSKGEDISPEDISAANEELETAGVSGVILVGSEAFEASNNALKALNSKFSAAVKTISPEIEEDAIEKFDLSASIKKVVDDKATAEQERDDAQAKLDDKGEEPKTTTKKGQQEFEEEEEEELSGAEKEQKQYQDIMAVANEISG